MRFNQRCLWEQNQRGEERTCSTNAPVTLCISGPQPFARSRLEDSTDRDHLEEITLCLNYLVYELFILQINLRPPLG